MMLFNGLLLDFCIA